MGGIDRARESCLRGRASARENGFLDRPSPPSMAPPLLWLALLSILFQGFCNLTMMRYTVYSGEPIIVGGLRTWPGPGLWIACYAMLDIASVWPYNASNAAVPLAAVVLGRLPQTDADQTLVKALDSPSSCWRSFRSSSAGPSIACSSGS